MKELITILDFTPELLSRQSMHLSGGNKRKLCIAMALITKPEILLFDEASSGLDPIARKKILNYLKSLDRTAVLMISHRADEVEEYSDRVGIMVEG